MAYRPVDVVEVRIWGHRVGAVARDPRTGYYAFAYDPVWRASGIELSPLHLPTSELDPVSFPSLPRDTYYGLPAFLADALPDDFGNLLINAELASEGVPSSAITPLDRLAYMSNRAMGALEFRPPRGHRTVKPTAIHLSQLVEASRLALRGEFTGDRQTQAALLSLIQVGTSAGGARAKAVVALNPKTMEIRSGQLPVEPGFEYWLIKLDGVGRDLNMGISEGYCRVEYACSKMARAAGIDMAETKLLEENGRAHFMTKRFDREGGVKHHIQSLCAMGHLDFRAIGTHDYSQYFQVIESLGMDAEAKRQGFRRMVFNALAMNCDDHPKNFAFMMPEGGSWKLSPAYDVTFSHNPQSQWTRQHLMSINQKFFGTKVADFMAVAKQFNIPGAADIVKEVMAAVDAWPEFAAVAGVSEDRIKHIHNLMPKLAPKSLNLAKWREGRVEAQLQKCAEAKSPKPP